MWKTANWCNLNTKRLFLARRVFYDIVDLTIGMKESSGCIGIYQDYLIGYIFSNEKLILDYLSTLRRGHRMQFGSFVGQAPGNVIEPKTLTKYTTGIKINTPKKWKFHVLLTNIFTKA